jgi:hypothetical protein
LALAVGAVGAVGFAAALWVESQRAWLAYLTAYVYAASLALGALIFLMIGYATNARWVAVVRRITEVVAIALWALAFLFLPIAFAMPEIYPWMEPDTGASAHELNALRHKAVYLNPAFFLIRTGIYFAIWIAVATLLLRRSLARDHRPPCEGDPELALRVERALSCALLPLVSLALTFAAFDWIMSLEPNWYSTIFGIYYFAGGFVGALALITLLAGQVFARREDHGALTPSHFYALGRLLLAFVIFWAYVAFFQLFLIEIADMPDEVAYFFRREGGAGNTAIYALIVGHFALPFLLLLPRAWKFSPRFLALVSGWILVMHYLDMSWLVLPARGSGVPFPHWPELAAILVVFAPCVAVVAVVHGRHPMVAIRDPFLPEGRNYRSCL